MNGMIMSSGYTPKRVPHFVQKELQRLVVGEQFIHVHEIRVRVASPIGTRRRTEIRKVHSIVKIQSMWKTESSYIKLNVSSQQCKKSLHK
jgi:hypothetical protein